MRRISFASSLSFALALAMGLGVGAVNGVLVALLRVNSLVTTIGMNSLMLDFEPDKK